MNLISSILLMEEKKDVGKGEVGFLFLGAHESSKGIYFEEVCNVGVVSPAVCW